MRFLSPGWLLALAALAVPIALHLWSRRGGAPIRIGSIRLLVGSPPAVRRAWRLQDPWQLLLRCALLATLVLALAEPARGPGKRGSAAWALVSGDLTGPEADALIDSLSGAGLPVRRLDPGNLWTALRDADEEAPPGTRFVVFAPDRLRYFHGARPAIRAAVEWRVREPPATVPPGAPAAREPRVAVVYADPDRRDDARYVTAAIRAAGGATGTPAIVTNRPAASLPPTPETDADWIVWLSARPVPEEILVRVRAGATLVRDGGASSAAASDRIVFVQYPSGRPTVRQTDGLDLPPHNAAPSPPADSAAPLWTDGAGRPLFTVAREGRGGGLVYRFRGRFHPSWGDLVLEPEFPHAFATLWGTAAAAADDDRRITVRQLHPARATGPVGDAPQGDASRSWFLPLWLLALALFAVERWRAR